MRIILVGLGCVGQAFLRMVSEGAASFSDFWIHPRIVAVADRGGAIVDEKGLNIGEVLMLKNRCGSVAADPIHGRPGLTALELLRDVEAEVLVEATPTNLRDGEPGLSHIREALRRGFHVVTTNKGPLALALPALMELAEYNGVQLRFSGTVGGGTPILDLGREGLFGNRVESVRGILNGTTNYILTRMAEAGLSINEALKEAQTLGYAEADPSIDIEGLDSACKLVIMANWVMHMDCSLRDVKVKGISDVTLEQVRRAEAEGMKVKLVASAIDGRLEVKPELVSRREPLCVDGTLNAVTFKAEPAGEVTIVGKGAGGMETASAIIRDLAKIRMEAAKLIA
ncbi:MAG: homoserine dehydrogenase [Candidatus Bathyarchaeia archaeon]